MVEEVIVWITGKRVAGGEFADALAEQSGPRYWTAGDRGVDVQGHSLGQGAKPAVCAAQRAHAAARAEVRVAHSASSMKATFPTQTRQNQTGAWKAAPLLQRNAHVRQRCVYECYYTQEARQTFPTYAAP